MSATKSSIKNGQTPKNDGKMKHSKQRGSRDNVVTLSGPRRVQYILIATQPFTAEQIQEFNVRMMTLKTKHGWTDRTHGLLVIKQVRGMIKGELSANSSELCTQTRDILNNAFGEYCKARGIPLAKLPVPQLATVS